MRIGISSPIVVAFPNAHAAWEREAGIDELAQIARRADELDFNHMTCSEHIAVPTEIAEKRGGTYWDPLATLGYLAAVTKQIRLATLVLVLGYHHPLEIAKRYGTLDTVSNGRLILGVGVGSLEQEFAMLGADFAGRGVKADEAMRALRASLGQTRPEFQGEHYEFSDMYVEPSAVQRRVPLWVGGSTRRSLRRAVELGEGWVPFGRTLDEYRSMLADVTLPDHFDVVLPTGVRLDPTGAPGVASDALNAAEAAGATIVNVGIASDSSAHYLEQLEALAVIRDELTTAVD